jgi:hypothetical protein
MYEQGKPVTCSKCGSTRLYEAEFRQYRGWLNSSAPGGELSSESNVIRVLVCLCGYPVETTGVRCLPPNERETLQRCLASARRYRDEIEPKSAKDRLRATFAERSELAATAKEVAHLHKIIEGMTKDSDDTSFQHVT